MTATNSGERLTTICAKLENRRDRVVSLLGREDIDWLITEVNRLMAWRQQAWSIIGPLADNSFTSLNELIYLARELCPAWNLEEDGEVQRLTMGNQRLRDVLREIDRLDTIDEGYGIIAELARAALNEED